MPARLIFLTGVITSSLIAQKKPITIDTLLEQSHENQNAQVEWSPDGKHFAYLQSGQVMLYDVPAKSDRVLLPLGPLEKVAVPVPEPPRSDWRNRRVTEDSLEWSHSGKQLLLSVAGDLFFFSLDTGAWEQLTATPEAERDPKLSPDGERVAFRRGSDLYTIDIASLQVSRLTDDGSATLLNGETDWVYPEELDLSTAYWWSPDSKHIAYMQFDIAHEFVYSQISLTGLRAIVEPERYPPAGAANADVHVGVVSASGGVTRWMDLGETRGFLIARVHWAPDSTRLLIERLNRIQNHLDLLVADGSAGNSRSILTETDPHWINVNDLFRFVSDSQFLWGSERDGFQHLYLYSLEGQHKRITEGDWEVTDIAGVDEGRQTIYYVSTQASPLERQLYSVKFNGKERVRISREPGTHEISMGPTTEYYLDTFSSLTEQPHRDVYSSAGMNWSTFRTHRIAFSNEYAMEPREIVQLKAQDGKILYGRLTKPSNFHAGEKYPAIVMVYGGPGVQTVVNGWEEGADAGLDQVLAARGFVVWLLDNRGSSGRGHAFETPLFRRFGKTELADQLEGVRYLIAQGFVDPSRVGIYGWSYGGFLALYSLLNAPDVFRAGIAGAPVTNWRNYDTIYTERYLGLPSENPEGYRASSAVEYAATLKAKLLIIHNIEDDNVLFQNTVQMTNALEQAGKLFEMVIYPEKTHGISGAVRRQLLETLIDFFDKNLK